MGLRDGGKALGVEPGLIAPTGAVNAGETTGAENAGGTTCAANMWIGDDGSAGLLGNSTN